jgi:hypothetical protein
MAAVFYPDRRLKGQLKGSPRVAEGLLEGSGSKPVVRE